MHQEISLDDVRDVVFHTDAEGRWTYLNAAWTAVTGFPVADSVGRVFLEFVHPEDRALNQRRFEPLILRKKDHCLHQVRYRTRDGGFRWIEVHARLTTDRDGAITGTTGTLRDVTEYRAAGRALDDERRALEAGPIVLLRCAGEPDGTVEFVSRNVERLGLRAETLLGRRRWDDVIHPQDRARAHAEAEAVVRAGGERLARSYRVLASDGAPRWVDEQSVITRDDEGRVTGCSGYVVDATDRRLLYDRMRQADRIIATGTLALGVAHEINNPLAYVASNLHFAREALQRAAGGDAGTVQEIDEALRDALDGADRIRRIVRDLRSMSRDGGEPEDLDLEQVVQTAVSLSGALVHHRAQLVQSIERVPAVRGDQVKLSQALMNLLVNAAQSIEGEAVGTIRLGVRQEGATVVVEVSDDGCGIDPEHLPRIFDPFFTTKPVGKGTGLGLSMARAGVEAMGGRIEVQSAPGQGATFRIVLPVADRPAVAAPSHASVRAAGAAAPLVLIVDDEPKVVAGLRRMLGDRYRVAVAATGAEALELLRAGRRFDAILCDLMMRETSGSQVLDELRRRFPDQSRRFVFITGGPFGAEAERTRGDDPPCLQKPFGPEEIDDVLQRVLSRAPTVHAA